MISPSSVVSALIVKLVSSFDDVIWLTPFLAFVSSRKKVLHASVYVLVSITISLLANALASGSTVVVTTLLTWPSSDKSPESALSLVSGFILLCYGSCIARKWLRERRARDQEENISLHDEECGAILPLLVEEAGSDFDEVAIRDQLTAKSLLVVAFFGSLDTLALFVPMIVGKAMELADFLLGTILAAFVIIALSICLGNCSLLAGFLKAMPFFVVVLVYGLLLCIKGLTIY